MNSNSTEPKVEAEEENPEETTAEELTEVAAEQKNTFGRDWFMRVFTLIFWSAIALGVAWFAGGKQFVTHHWTALALLLVAAVLVVTIPSTQRWYERINAQRRIGFVILILIILIGLFFIVVFLLEPVYQAALLRTIFLIIVCSLPALMYYLFIATKKYSLLNEFILNLTRLGLINPERVPRELVCNELQRETEQERKNRINTYMQKFEAVYGAIPTNLSGMVLEPTDSNFAFPEKKKKAAESGGLSTILTVDTTIPVIVATILIALGWLITLPPWQGKLVLGGQSTQTTTEVRSNKSTGADQPLPQSPPSPGSAAAAVQPSPPPQGEASTEKWLAVYTPISSPVRFAFIGAYFFTLQMLFRRYVRRDLRSSAYVSVSLRIILAVIGIWVVVEAVAMTPPAWLTSDQSKAQVEKSLLVLGFVLGVFPRVGWQVIQTSIKRVFSIVVPSLQTQLPLSDLDGLTVWHEARLEEEDVENIPNMATADLIDLLINTRFPPDRIIDWVDQAILYTHIGPQAKDGDDGLRSILRAHGIRTATSLVEDYNRSEFHNDRESFEGIIAASGRNPMRSLVDAVGTNPTLKLIQTWKGLMPHSHGQAPEGSEAGHLSATPQVEQLSQPSPA
jgi:hypothetical protein